MDAPVVPGEAERAEALEKRAAELVPVLEARAAETEALRRLPDETVADLKAAGLSRLCQPRRYGGAELPIDRAVRVVAATARGCASAAWICAIHSDHAIILGMFADEASEDVWGADPEAVISAGFFPAGGAERVDGGWRLSGKWGWVSGCDFADWLLLATVAPVRGEAPEHAFFLVPASAAEIEDNWHVMGLRGTGSKNVVVEDCVVPDHRTLAYVLARDGEAARAKGEARPLYRLPHTCTVPFFFNAVGIGVAEGALDAVAAQIAGRESRGVRLAGLPTLQAGLAEAAAEIDCARLLVERDAREAMAAMRAGRSLTMRERARNRRDQAYAGRLCRSAVDRLHAMSGASAIFDGHAAERRFRDAHAVASHYIQSWEIAGATYGEVAFGLEPSSPMI